VSWNPVNDWIRAGGDHDGKKKRRLIVAGVCGGLAALCALAAPIGLIGTVVFGAIAVIKIKNAATDES